MSFWKGKNVPRGTITDMINCKDFKSFVFNAKNVTKKSGKNSILYDNNIYTLDFETTSFFINESNEAEIFDYSKGKNYYNKLRKSSTLYLWQFSINDTVFFGRDLKELDNFLIELNMRIPNRKIIFSHNLGFEFQFLRNILEDVDIFAMKKRAPMKIFEEWRNIEFRCSYILSGMSLKNVAKNLNIEIPKLEMEYNVMRHCKTVLNKNVLEYAKRDCEIVYNYILTMQKEYINIYNIPLTSTGKVRRVISQKMKKCRTTIKKIRDMQPENILEFHTIFKAFAGGYTHANAIYTNLTIPNVDSYDIVSSYPAAMCCEKFPMSKFRLKKISNFLEIDDNKCHIMKLILKNVKSITNNSFLSVSKCEKIRNCVNDNGRIVSCDFCIITLTCVDIKTLMKTYEYEYEIVECRISEKGYLPKIFITYILELFSNKTVFKEVEGKEDIYNLSKSYINSLYGMCVTNTIRDEIQFDGEWHEKQISREEISKKLNEQKTSENTFLNFSWGVFITAYARKNLWDMILKCDDILCYADTDSVKIIRNNEIEKHISEYNLNVTKKMYAMCDFYNIDKKLCSPVSPKGKAENLGFFELDGSYNKFRTLGAKKYCYEKDGELYITVSGVSKTAVSALKKIEDFNDELEFDYETSGRIIVHYCDNQEENLLIDDNGIEYITNDNYGICAQPTKYSMSISDEYQDYFTAMQDKKTVNASILM